MIDEDKYEGHTEGPWEVLCGPELVQEAHEYDLKWAKPHNPNGGSKMGIGHLNLFFLKTPFNNAIPDHLEDKKSRCGWAEGYAMEWFEEEAANAQLMADAPLLLAEVKRLREIEEEWILMWDTLEELNLVADVRKNMTEHGFTFETDEEMIE